MKKYTLDIARAGGIITSIKGRSLDRRIVYTMALQGYTLTVDGRPARNGYWTDEKGDLNLSAPTGAAINDTVLEIAQAVQAAWGMEIYLAPGVSAFHPNPPYYATVAGRVYLINGFDATRKTGLPGGVTRCLPKICGAMRGRAFIAIRTAKDPFCNGATA